MIFVLCCALQQYNVTCIILLLAILRASEVRHNTEDARKEFRKYFIRFLREILSTTLPPDGERQRAHNVRIEYFITFFSTFPCSCSIVTTTYNL